MAGRGDGRDYHILLAGRSETEAEAQGVVSEGGRVPAPVRGTRVWRREVP